MLSVSRKVLFLCCERFWTIERRNNGNNTPLLIERHAVDADLAMDAWLVMDEVLIDAMINDVPLVLARNLEHRVMSGAINLILGLLLDDEVIILIDIDGTEGRFRCAVANVVVG